MNTYMGPSGERSARSKGSRNYTQYGCFSSSKCQPLGYCLHCFSSFSTCDFSQVLVNKAEVDVFLELSSFFDNPPDVDNLISGSSAFSKFSLNIWKFMVHVLLKPSFENFEHYFASM